MLTMSAGCRDGREYMASPTDVASKESSRKSMSETSASELSNEDGAESAPAPVILFLGNSLSAGYGINPREAFPSLIEERIDSLGWDFRVVNAGISGDTSADRLARQIGRASCRERGG